mmetsp:Transcript_8073/g.10578  ORF Transcript_8073/g.10578 Transcript_8073/m.10578 type:complete len:86 (-) Transcript_8073:157-414(-)
MFSCSLIYIRSKNFESESVGPDLNSNTIVTHKQATCTEHQIIMVTTTAPSPDPIDDENMPSLELNWEEENYSAEDIEVVKTSYGC